MNRYLKELHDAAKLRFPVEGANMLMSEWITKNTHITRNKLFEFEGYEYQRAIVDDLHPDLTCIKPSQVGLTEIQIRKFLSLLKRNAGSSGIFTLPNETMYKRVSKTRVKPLIQREAVFNTSLGESPSRSMDLYEIDESFAYFNGMTEGDATSIPADFIFHDELDLSPQSIVGLYQSRLQNSRWKVTQKFSTPTVPGFGIDASYKISDQHEYTCKCSSCNHYNLPEFNMRFLHLPGYNLGPETQDLAEMNQDDVSKINLDESYFKCEKCGTRLDLGNPELREWIPKFPTRATRGYKLTPTCRAFLDPKYITLQLLKMSANNALKSWYNTVLGLPYSDGNTQLTDEAIKGVMDKPTAVDIGDRPVSVGIDVGKVCHIVVGVLNDAGNPSPIHFEICKASDLHDRLSELDKKYNIICGSIDRHPYTPTAEKVRDDFDGRILPVEYRGSQPTNLVYDVFQNLSHAQCNRTTAIDAVVSNIRSGKITMSGYGQYKQTITEHLKDMVRIEAEEKPATWEKLTGNDHFFHALVFMNIATKVVDIIEFKDNDFVNSLLVINGINENTNRNNKPLDLLYGRGSKQSGGLI